MKTLRISKDVALPLDLITQTVAVLAKRRSGKSYTMRRIAEQLLAAHQQIVLVDPKGDQWGIRSSADGCKEGYPITILGGEHGDVPLEVGAGELVAKLVVEERVSILLDLSMFRKHEIATFMTAFMENLYRLKAQEKYRTPVMLIIDEADAIAPQKPQRGEERMLGAAEDIVRRGGQRGIGCMLITQRSAVLNKNVLTQAQMLIVLRTIAPQDLAAMNAWIDVHGEPEQRKILMESLPSLPIGDAWFWSPGWPTNEGIFMRSHVLPIETFDSGATPKPGEKKIVPKKLARPDLEALKKQMAATIEKAKADDPKELKKKIAALELELKKRSAVTAKPGEKRVEVKVADPAAIMAALKTRDADWKPTLEAANREVARLGKIIGSVARLVGSEYTITNAAFSPPVLIATPTKIGPEELRKIEPGGVRVIPYPEGGRLGVQAHRDFQQKPEGVSGPGQKILDAIAWMEAIGVPQPNKVAVAFVSGYSSTSSNYVKTCGTLRSQGLVEYPAGGMIALTNAGREVARIENPPTSNADLHERIYSVLNPAEGKILRPIIDAFIQVRKADVAAVSGYSETSSNFVKILGKLRTLGLIDYPEPGYVRATSILFPIS